MGRKKLTYGRDPNLSILCVICGDKARGNDFSVLSCVSCKSFFRRHGLLDTGDVQCRYGGNCVITKETRSGCLPCRLMKCIESGMDPLKIRCPLKMLTNSERTQPSVTTNDKQLQLPMPEPLNLLRNDSSTLTTDRWNLLSNIIRSFDEQHFNNRFLSRTYETVLPLMEHSSHLRSLSAHARRALLSSNVVYTASLSEYFIGYEIDSFRHPTYMSACSALFGSDFMMKYAQDNERLLSNGNLYKLMLFVLIFSPNCSIVMFNGEKDLETISTSIELFNVQNICVTMLWEYLVSLILED